MDEFSISKDTIVVGIVAALVDHKDHETLLRAVSKIETSKNLFFVLVGQGVRNKIKNLARGIKIEDKVILQALEMISRILCSI